MQNYLTFHMLESDLPDAPTTDTVVDVDQVFMIVAHSESTSLVYLKLLPEHPFLVQGTVTDLCLYMDKLPRAAVKVAL